VREKKATKRYIDTNIVYPEIFRDKEVVAMTKVSYEIYRNNGIENTLETRAERSKAIT
jgi:hypothetical protein